MAKVAIVGAGVMGSALVIPLSDNGHQVALCGTEFDRATIDRCLEERWHPALKAHLPPSVRPFHIEDLAEALREAEVVVIAVISKAVGRMAEKIGPFLPAERIIVNVAKGLEVDEGGQIRILPQVIRDSLPHEHSWRVPIVVVGGPAKALELAARRQTFELFASEHEEALRHCVEIFSTSYYHIRMTSDVVGLEICAAMKNGYAIAMGICDGQERAFLSGEATMDNLRSAVFAQAMHEMAELTKLFGGQEETACGLGGLGDFYVTCRQGRNLTLGQLIGEGYPFCEAIEMMKGTSVEGVEAVQAMHRALSFRLKAEKVRERFPLLDYLYNSLSEKLPPSLPLELFF